MKKKKLLIMNLSGTLLLPGDEVVFVVWCNAIKRAGLIPDYALIYSHYGEDFKESVIPKMAKKNSWPESSVDNIITYAKEAFKEVNRQSNANLSEKLTSLKDRGYALGLVSNKSRDQVIRSLSKIGCDSKLFDFIKTGDDGIKKPDIRVFDAMLAGFQPEDVTLVGDSINYDYPMAKEAGLGFVAIATKCFPPVIWKMHVSEKFIFKSFSEYVDSLLEA